MTHTLPKINLFIFSINHHRYLQPYCPTVCMTENMGAPFSIFINGEILDTTLFLSTVGAVSLLLLASSTFSSDYSSPMRACYSQKQTDCFDTSDSLILIWPNISFPFSSFFPVCRKTLCTETSNWETWCWTNGKRNVFTHTTSSLRWLANNPLSFYRVSHFSLPVSHSVWAHVCERGPGSLYLVCIWL